MDGDWLNYKLPEGKLKIKSIKSCVNNDKLSWSHSKDFDRHIIFRLTGVCNYNCPYCHWKEQKHYNHNDIINTVHTVQGGLKHDRLYWYFHGGEPTTYPKFVEVVDCINKYKGTQIEVQTNGHKNLSWFKQIESDVVVNSYSISYHHSECLNFNNFYDNVSYIFSLNKLENLDIMFQTGIHDKNKFKENVRYLVESFGKHIEVTFGYIGYSEADKEDWKTFYEEIAPHIHKAEYCIEFIDGTKAIYNKSELFSLGVNTKGLLCDAMCGYIAISGNGDYAPCGTLQVQGCIDNLLHNSLLFRVKSKLKTICPVTNCAGEWYLNQYKQ